MKVFIFVLTILTLTACRPLIDIPSDKPTKAEKKLARLLDKHPELYKSDTTYIVDSISTDKIIIDTVLNVSKDTIYLEDGINKVQIVRTLDTLIHIRSICDTDTIIREIPVWIREVIDNGKTGVDWRWYAIGILVLVLLVVIITLKTVLKFIK